MTCREMSDFLFDYVGGELPEETRVSFEAHIGNCHNCLVYVEQYRETITAGRAAFEELDHRQAPCDLPEELIQAILRTLKRTP